jgi:hypothetical protein
MLLRIETHCHTWFSGDSLARPEHLLRACQRKSIDRLAITDHNRIEGGLRARELDPERVIVGEEIMTRQGELLALYVTERIPPGLPPMEAIARLRSQGAFISVSHPFDAQRHGAWDLADLTQIAPLVDAIEVFNARCLSKLYNQRAAEFARANSLAGTAGSDAHAVSEVGRVTMLVPEFEGPQGLRASIRGASIDGCISSAWVHFFSVYARWVKHVAPSRYPPPL